MHPETIEPARYYSVRQLSMMNVLPWRSPMTIAKVLKEEKWKEIFQPMMYQKNNGLRIYVKGESLLKFLDMVSKGELNK